jgi:hypothetical protein
MSIGDERIFTGANVNEDHVRVPGDPEFNRLSGSDGDDIHAGVVFRFKIGEDGIEQAGVGGAGSSSQAQDLGFGRSGGFPDRSRFDDRCRGHGGCGRLARRKQKGEKEKEKGTNFHKEPPKKICVVIEYHNAGILVVSFLNVN